MRVVKISRGGQITVPADIRKRWAISRVLLRDEGERLIVEPASEDPVSAVRGMAAAAEGPPSEVVRAGLRDEEARRPF
jgi:AbrB family looped-hinge helix DNA binding protein